MTKNDIKTRIEELKKLRDQALANANAIGGAIQDCEFWLEWLDNQAKGEDSTPPKPHLVEG